MTDIVTANVVTPQVVFDNVLNAIAQQFAPDNMIADMITLFAIGIPKHILDQATSRALNVMLKPIIDMALKNIEMMVPLPLLVYGKT